MEVVEEEDHESKAVTASMSQDSDSFRPSGFRVWYFGSTHCSAGYQSYASFLGLEGS